MRKPRRTYKVYRNGTLIDETFAVSEKQAINNVRHNVCGDFESQYSCSADWSAEPKYKSSPVNVPEPPKQITMWGDL